MSRYDEDLPLGAESAWPALQIDTRATVTARDGLVWITDEDGALDLVSGTTVYRLPG